MSAFRQCKPIGCSRVLAFVGALLVSGALGCGHGQPSSVLGDASNPIDVKTYPVATQTIRRNVQAVGSLYAWDESTVSTEVEGRIDRVLVDVGDSVREGQVMVELDPVELQYQLDSQRAAVRQVRAQLGIGPNDPPPPDPSRVAFVQRAAADLSDAEQKFRRAQEMYRASLIPQQQLDEAGTRLQAMKAAYDVSLQDVDRFKAQLQSSEAAANLAEKKLSEASIRAPYQGAVKTRSVSPGEYLKAQSPVMVVVRTDKLRARLQVPERWAGSVKVGAAVDVQVEAFPGQVFHGQIQRINPAVSQDSRTFDVEAMILNADARLKPGFFLQASMPSTLEEKALTVPERAVTYRYGVYKVFVMNGYRVAERQIKPGLQTDDAGMRKMEVVEGLSAGDRVAIAVQGGLRDGAIVREQDRQSDAGGTK